MAHAVRRALFGVVVLLALIPVASAGAQTSGCSPGQAATGATQYPVGRGQLTVDKTTAKPGDPVTVSGCGFKPGTSVSIDLLSTPVHLATVTADANGGIAATVTIPKNTPAGKHTLEATGIDPAGRPLVLSASITVAGAPLARTGTSATAPLTAAGVGLVVIGGVAVFAARRRRAARAEA